MEEERSIRNSPRMQWRQVVEEVRVVRVFQGRLNIRVREVWVTMQVLSLGRNTETMDGLQAGVEADLAMDRDLEREPKVEEALVEKRIV